MIMITVGIVLPIIINFRLKNPKVTKWDIVYKNFEKRVFLG